MKLEITTTITTLVDMDTLAPEHSVIIDAGGGLPVSVVKGIVAGAARSLIMNVDPDAVERGWEADETIRSTMSPRGPKYMVDGWFSTPEEIAAFPQGRRVKRLKATEWQEATDE